MSPHIDNRFLLVIWSSTAEMKSVCLYCEKTFSQNINLFFRHLNICYIILQINAIYINYKQFKGYETLKRFECTPFLLTFKIYNYNIKIRFESFCSLDIFMVIILRQYFNAVKNR